MDLTLPLIVAHFLADYPLQTNGMVAFKTKRFTGVMLHSLMHVLTSAVFAFPFIRQPRLWWAIAVVFVTHNILDASKVWAQRRFPQANSFDLYVLDQVAHMCVIVGTSLVFLRNLVPDFGWKWLSVYQNGSVLAFALALILATFFYDVTAWTLRNRERPQPYVRDWRVMGRNALGVVVVFSTYWWVA
jgi:hypothetical protein